ncbi:MAG: Rpn family recombination-promoting nuclease/putative transposase, partial [Fibromonadaceae bacterium]|nr:Rpn family recombination-promoting nuclease/putative transposase [Fibromonadaceae bacterium]
IFSLRHAHELKVKPEQFCEEVFEKIFDIAKIAKFSKEERAKYEANMMNQRDQYAALKCARDEGEARGMEKVFSLLESGMSLAEAKRKLGQLPQTSPAGEYISPPQIL